MAMDLDTLHTDGKSEEKIYKEKEELEKSGFKQDKKQEALLTGLLTERLTGGQSFGKIFYYETVGSTNEEAKKKLAEANTDGVLLVADSQTNGRGRRGRSWNSPGGESVYMSLAWRPSLMPEQVSMVTLVMALAVAKVVREQASAEVFIKWPNDIVLNGKKICGILTELNFKRESMDSLVVGVGLNVNGQAFPKELEKTATSLFLETGRFFSRAELTAEIVKQFATAYDRFSLKGDLSDLLEDYNSFLVNREKQVKVLDPKQEWKGIAKGINEKGELLVETEAGEMVKVYAGEVSVRGIYGYV